MVEKEDKEKKSKDITPTTEKPELDVNTILETVKNMIPDGAVANLLTPCHIEPEEELSELHLIGSESMILKILGKE